jgi:DNA-binding transcriptional LysR family regulator
VSFRRGAGADIVASGAGVSQTEHVDTSIDAVYRTGVVLQHLTYLAALARERHFGRAAAACGVSQPTLSAGIRRLEQELGFPVVRRGHRFEGLTPEGERVLDWAQQILADVDGLEVEVAALRGGLGGRLRIGAIPTALSSVSSLTTPLCARHPSVTVTVQSLSSMQIERGLDEFELDAGLTYLDWEPLVGVRALPLYRERYVLLTQADGPFAGARRVRWRDAAAAPLCLLTEDMQNRRIVNAIFREAGGGPRPGIETNSITALVAHVRDGRWSSVMARAWLHIFDVPADLRAIPLVAPETTRSIGLVWRDRDPEPLLVRALLEVAGELDLQAALDPVTP